MGVEEALPPAAADEACHRAMMREVFFYPAELPVADYVSPGGGDCGVPSPPSEVLPSVASAAAPPPPTSSSDGSEDLAALPSVGTPRRGVPPEVDAYACDKIRQIAREEILGANRRIFDDPSMKQRDLAEGSKKAYNDMFTRLKERGWTYKKGDGLVDWVYVSPSKAKYATLRDFLLEVSAEGSNLGRWNKQLKAVPPSGKVQGVTRNVQTGEFHVKLRVRNNDDVPDETFRRKVDALRKRNSMAIDYGLLSAVYDIGDDLEAILRDVKAYQETTVEKNTRCRFRQRKRHRSQRSVPERPPRDKNGGELPPGKVALLSTTPGGGNIEEEPGGERTEEAEFNFDDAEEDVDADGDSWSPLLGTDRGDADADSHSPILPVDAPDSSGDDDSERIRAGAEEPARCAGFVEQPSSDDDDDDDLPLDELKKRLRAKRASSSGTKAPAPKKPEQRRDDDDDDDDDVRDRRAAAATDGDAITAVEEMPAPEELEAERPVVDANDADNALVAAGEQRLVIPPPEPRASLRDTTESALVEERAVIPAPPVKLQAGQPLTLMEKPAVAGEGATTERSATSGLPEPERRTMFGLQEAVGDDVRSGRKRAMERRDDVVVVPEPPEVASSGAEVARRIEQARSITARIKPTTTTTTWSPGGAAAEKKIIPKKQAKKAARQQATTGFLATLQTMQREEEEEAARPPADAEEETFRGAPGDDSREHAERSPSPPRVAPPPEVRHRRLAREFARLVGGLHYKNDKSPEGYAWRGGMVELNVKLAREAAAPRVAAAALQEVLVAMAQDPSTPQSTREAMIFAFHEGMAQLGRTVSRESGWPQVAPAVVDACIPGVVEQKHARDLIGLVDKWERKIEILRKDAATWKRDLERKKRDLERTTKAPPPPRFAVAAEPPTDPRRRAKSAAAAAAEPPTDPRRRAKSAAADDDDDDKRKDTTGGHTFGAPRFRSSSPPPVRRDPPPTRSPPSPNRPPLPKDNGEKIPPPPSSSSGYEKHHHPPRSRDPNPRRRGRSGSGTPESDDFPRPPKRSRPDEGSRRPDEGSRRRDDDDDDDESSPRRGPRTRPDVGARRRSTVKRARDYFDDDVDDWPSAPPRPSSPRATRKKNHAPLVAGHYGPPPPRSAVDDERPPPPRSAVDDERPPPPRGAVDDERPPPPRSAVDEQRPPPPRSVLDCL
eukprot:CAMPEP_0118914388 /NCGR_PEP_ID=MMETSP1166-20130328/14768_1 /TAXON_ID=1104430 /ORGANISM="Chrysoreinhardia sp, Strain CCMP3193" /LENGTH=1175 /DNA_ID=CAMNT_0006853967 /DNA_START=200 /DNA_END=3727 /DNA_ORIENTATION=-